MSDDWRRSAAQGLLAVGSTVRFERTFTQAEVDQFGVLTRDYNPVHDDPRWCEHKGLRGPICHGLLVASMLCEPGGQWGWLATGMSLRFLRPVYVGDTVSCQVTIVELGERGFARAECVMAGQDGEVAVTALLTGYLPHGDERGLLSELARRDDPRPRSVP